MSIAVSRHRYRSRRSDETLRERLLNLAREKPRYGYRRLQVLVERKEERVNHKRLYRVYREAGLCLKRKKRRHCVRSGLPLSHATAANQEWALDFAHDVKLPLRVYLWPRKRLHPKSEECTNGTQEVASGGFALRRLERFVAKRWDAVPMRLRYTRNESRKPARV
jgi:hypothetical protein